MILFNFQFEKQIKKDEQLVDSLPTELKNIISFDFTINDRRHCNWIKFLNIKTKLNSQVNLVCNYNDVSINLFSHSLVKKHQTIFSNNFNLKFIYFQIKE